MQVTVTISDEIAREAGIRKLTIVEFVESLVDKGFLESRDRQPVMLSAIERIRALRTAVAEDKK